MFGRKEEKRREDKEDVDDDEFEWNQNRACSEQQHFNTTMQQTMLSWAACLFVFCLSCLPSSLLG